MFRLLLLAVFLLPGAARAAWPAGAEIDPAAAMDVTPDGFAVVSDMVPALVPAQIGIPGFNQGGSGQCCPFGSWSCFTCYSWRFQLTNGWVGMNVTELEITPQTGYLALDAGASVQVNTPQNPLNLYAYGAVELPVVGPILSVSQNCKGNVDPFAIDLGTDVTLDVVTGTSGRTLDAGVGHLDWTLGLSGNDLHLEECLIGDIIDAVQDAGGWVGIDPIGLILDLLRGTLDGVIQGLAPEIETALEDAFGVASLRQDVDLGGATLTVALEPSDVEITTAGMRISLAGSFDAPPHDCVAAYPQPGSLETPGALPGLATAPAPIRGHDLGLLVSDDLVNSALYGVWRAGTLCATIDDSAGPINTTLLSLLSSDAFGDLFPTSAPMEIVTRPRRPPEAFAGGTHAMDVTVDDLGLDMYAELDARQARVVGLDLTVDAGLDFGFDSQTGELTVAVALGTGSVQATVTHDDLAPGHAEDIEDAFGGVFDTLAGFILGDLLSDIRIGLPSLDGIGLQALDVAASGPAGDWFGMYAAAGPVTYVGGSGCDQGGSCASGCSSTGSGNLLAWLVLPAIATVRRRRRAT